jgi:hypothetical protein
MIYRVTSKDIFEDNPGLLSNVKLADCSDRELKYIFLLYDYESPYAKMSFEVRKNKAASEAGYLKEKTGKRFDRNARDTMTGKRPRIQEAIGEFKIIQDSTNKEMAIVVALDAQIDNITKFIAQPSDDVNIIQKGQKIAESLPKLLENRRRIREILNMVVDEEDTTIMASDNISTLDEVNDEE